MISDLRKALDCSPASVAPALFFPEATQYVAWQSCRNNEGHPENGVIWVAAYVVPKHHRCAS